MILEAIKHRLAICQIRNAVIPLWATQGEFFSICKTNEELSIVCDESNVPIEVDRELGWRALKVQGPLDFSLTGILASIATPLSEANIPIFAISTFNTDYVLVKEANLAKALGVLCRAGHTINDSEYN